MPTVTDNPDDALCENILQRAGFKNAMRLVLRIKVGGLLWMAPVCKSWNGFLNISRTRRRKGNQYRGRQAYQPVVDGNRMASIAMLFFIVAWARGVYPVIENPANSLMWSYFIANFPMNDLPSHSATCARCAFSREPLGQRLWKRFKFLATDGWINALEVPCACPKKLHTELVKVQEVDGRMRRTGISKSLSLSGEYPVALGKAIIDAWQAKLEDEEDENVRPAPKPGRTARKGKAKKPKASARKARARAPKQKKSKVSPSNTSDAKNDDAEVAVKKRCMKKRCVKTKPSSSRSSTSKQQQRKTKVAQCKSVVRRPQKEKVDRGRSSSWATPDADGDDGPRFKVQSAPPEKRPRTTTSKVRGSRSTSWCSPPATSDFATGMTSSSGRRPGQPASGVSSAASSSRRWLNPSMD
jgi:hypothetical protein